MERQNNTETEMVVKQCETYGQIMCCKTTATTNNIRDKIEYRCGEVKLGISVLMGNIAAIGERHEQISIWESQEISKKLTKYEMKWEQKEKLKKKKSL